MTLRVWYRNLVEHSDGAVTEGRLAAKVWGLYMAASRVAWRRTTFQLHQVLAANVDPRRDDSPPAPTAVVALAWASPQSLAKQYIR